MPKVLIVDDEPSVRRLLAEVLAPEHADGRDGFELVEADDLASARAAVLRGAPDVALVDKNLPDGSGLDLVRELKARDPHLEVILITAFATLESAIAAVEVGAFDYLVKPFPELAGVRLKVRNAAEKARLARREAQHRHAQKMEALGRLAGGIAHDFNNLLCIVVNCVDTALADVKTAQTGPQTIEALEDIVHAAGSATRLTRQLLAFSRRPSGAVELIDVDGMLGELRSMLARVLGAEIALVLQLDAGAAVRMPRTHLEQVVANLVVNARDAIGRRGTLTIETRVLGGSVELLVRDTGSGMSPDVAARIFEPFFTTKPTGAGTGLGLSIVQTIVEEAGGSITVDSQPGCGTAFRILLPASAPATASVAADSGDGLPRSKGERVLIVEDDDVLRTVLVRMFQRAGWYVTAASDGAEALASSQGRTFDLLVADIVMPNRSGDELAELLVRAQPSLKTVYISGHNDHIVRGDAAMVAKPFGERELGAMVRRVLGGEVRTS